MSKHIYKDVATHLPEHCRPTADILAQFGGKWPFAIFGLLSAGPMRFSELVGSIDGLSERMLTLTLKSMERDGMISRHVTAGVPPRVEYQLTERGQSLQAPLAAMYHWAEAHADGIAQSRQVFDADNT